MSVSRGLVPAVPASGRTDIDDAKRFADRVAMVEHRGHREHVLHEKNALHLVHRLTGSTTAQVRQSRSGSSPRRLSCARHREDLPLPCR